MHAGLAGLVVSILYMHFVAQLIIITITGLMVLLI